MFIKHRNEYCSHDQSSVFAIDNHNDKPAFRNLFLIFHVSHITFLVCFLH